MGKQTGTVAKWLNHKGIGFITPEGETEGENDILVHFGEVKQTTEDGFISLEAGSAVEFEVEVDPKNEDKKIAVKVTGKDGADCTPRTKGKGKGKKGRGKGKKGKGKGKKGEKKEEEEEKEE